MIDSGNSPKQANDFLQCLREMNLDEPDLIAITHCHCDHIFGLSALKGMIIASKMTCMRIKEMNKLGWNDTDVTSRVQLGLEHEMTLEMMKMEMPGDRSDFYIRQPEIIYENRIDFDLGNRDCIIERIGGNHSPDSAMIYVPDSKIAFIGDCLYLRNKNQIVIDSLKKQLLTINAEIYIDSHRKEPISREQIEYQISEYLE
jgi:glyoxylase-like metal-dependent hydrolase (beta-lactamase superfamily II)